MNFGYRAEPGFSGYPTSLIAVRPCFQWVFVQQAAQKKFDEKIGRVRIESSFSVEVNSPWFEAPFDELTVSGSAI
jgi:hypothetical protein